MHNSVFYGNAARNRIIQGVNTVADAVKVTLGPMGRNVIMRIGTMRLPSVTKDGVTVARNVKKLADPLEDMGAQMVIEAAQKTAVLAGDGTTTSTILAQSIIMLGAEAIANGANPIDIKRGIDLGVAAAVKHLSANAKKINDDPTAIFNVANISANNDSEIGKLIAEAIAAVGPDGLITVHDSLTAQTYVKKVEGMQFDRGFISPFLVNKPESRSVELDNPLILLFDKAITNGWELQPALQLAVSAKRSILVIAEDISGEALQMLVTNKIEGGRNFCGIRIPGFGNSKADVLQDIAILTNGKVISEDMGSKLTAVKVIDMGSAEKIIITKDTTTIFGGAGTAKAITIRCEEIKSQLKNCDLMEEQKLGKRLANLSNGVALMYIGANTEVELKEKKDRIDDALRATRCAIEEGILPGGGIAYVRTSAALKIEVDAAQDLNAENEDRIKGMRIVVEALSFPFRQILYNAGLDTEEILTEVQTPSHEQKLEYDFGYNAKNNLYEFFYQTGVIDPAKVARVALESAASIAGVLLLAECAIIEEN